MKFEKNNCYELICAFTNTVSLKIKWKEKVNDYCSTASFWMKEKVVVDNISCHDQYIRYINWTTCIVWQVDI